MSKDDEQSFYICGWCKTKVFHLKSEEPTIPCPGCGYVHKDRDINDVPAKIKMDISGY